MIPRFQLPLPEPEALKLAGRFSKLSLYVR